MRKSDDNGLRVASAVCIVVFVGLGFYLFVLPFLIGVAYKVGLPMQFWLTETPLGLIINPWVWLSDQSEPYADYLNFLIKSLGI